MYIFVFCNWIILFVNIFIFELVFDIVIWIMVDNSIVLFSVFRCVSWIKDNYNMKIWILMYIVKYVYYEVLVMGNCILL